MDNNFIELLAPAGDWEAFLAAVENGANAVYLGGKLFNARQQASNFDGKQLVEAIDYAHVSDVKVYLTVNTIISEEEMEEALAFVKEAYIAGIDGIIVQDIGLASLVKKTLPDLDIHASTQMTVYNLEGVELLKNLGFKRVILARELSLDEILHITKNTDIDIEIFVHGALCISYSGQCLMSSMIGGRSGNRGKCAQPCRLPYTFNNEKKYLLSPKDLSTIHILDSIIEAGVRSLKIEGRMKTPEYVATVVRIYRKYMDKVLDLKNNNKSISYTVEESDLKDLTQIFNRGGFSKGYLKGKPGRDLMAYHKPKNWGINIGKVISYDNKSSNIKLKLEDSLSIGDGIEIWNGEDNSPGTVVTRIVRDGKKITSANKGDIVNVGDIRGKISKGNPVYRTSEKRLNIAARESFTKRSGIKVPIMGRMEIHANKPLSLMLWDAGGNTVHVLSDFIPETAINYPITEERVKTQLNKTGDTPFEFAELFIDIEGSLSVPASEINKIRRMALEELQKTKTHKFRRNKESIRHEDKLYLYAEMPFSNKSEITSEVFKLSVLFYDYNNKEIYNPEKLNSINVERIYLPFRSFFNENLPFVVDALHRQGKEIFAWLPSITKGNYDKVIKSGLNKIIEMDINGFLIGNIGSLGFFRDYPDIKLVGDFSFNIFNSFTINKLFQLGLQEVTLTPEMTIYQIESIKKGLPDNSGNIEALVYGRIPLMTSEHCVIGSTFGDSGGKSRCSSRPCKNQNNVIRDRMGMDFPVISDDIDCRSVILNSKVLFIPDMIERLKKSPVNMGRICIYDESIDRINEIVSLYRNIIYGETKDADKFKELIRSIKEQGFTKGHYFKGV
ncbi:MAG TPA: U32 family peptidase [Clostridiaceae bacterium]|nr:U32 family peptidase [Clostridiaceae bacterium]